MAKTALEIVLVDDGSPAASRQPGPPVDTPRVSAASRGTPAANEKSETLAAAPATSPSEARSENPIARQAGQVASALEAVEEASLPLSSAFSELTTKVERLSDTLDHSDTEGSEAGRRRGEERPRPDSRSEVRPSGRRVTHRDRRPVSVRTPRASSAAPTVGRQASTIAARIAGSNRISQAGAQAAGRLATLSEQAAGTSAALSSVAAAGAAVAAALAGVVVVAAAVVVAIKKMHGALAEASDRLQDLSPEVAAAQAAREVQQIRDEMKQAQELGAQLAEFERARARIDSDIKRIQTAALEALLEIWTLLGPSVEEVIKLLSIIADNIKGIARGVFEGAMAAVVGSAVLQWMKKQEQEREAAGDDAFVDDPFLKQWLGELPPADGDGAGPGGNGGGVP